MLSRADFALEPFVMMEALKREMDRMFDGFERGFIPGSFGVDAFPSVELADEGERFVVRAEVPGVGDGDLDVTYDRGAVSIRARRDAAAPEGWSIHRKERPSFELSRVIALPAPIDPERAEATLRDGLLEIALPKSPEAAPRRLPIKSAS